MTKTDLIGQVGEFLAAMLGGPPRVPATPPSDAYREAQHPRVARGRPGAGQWTRKAALHYGPGPHPDGSLQAVHGGGSPGGARSGLEAARAKIAAMTDGKQVVYALRDAEDKRQITPFENDDLFNEWMAAHRPATPVAARPARPKEDFTRALPRERLSEHLRGLPEQLGGGRYWAARFTDNWAADKARGYSFAEWGIDAYRTKAEAQQDFANSEIIYSREMGGYMPKLKGISAFGDTNAQIAFEKLERWEAGKYPRGAHAPYRGIVVFEAQFNGIGSDGEDLVTPIANGRVIRARQAASI